MTTQTIGLINRSSRITDPAQIQHMADAVTRQIQRHAAPAWGVHSAAVVPTNDSATLPVNAVPIYLFDDSDEPNALGYHTEDANGLRYARVFVSPVLDNGGGVLDPGDIGVSVASVLSHEALEWLIDPACSTFDGPDENGVLYAREVGDPVEADGYVIHTHGVPVLVSNFIFPEWSDPQAPSDSRFDQLGKLSAPYTMTSGGYLITFEGGQVNQRFGEDVPEWRRTTKEHPAARSARRLARLGVS